MIQGMLVSGHLISPFCIMFPTVIYSVFIQYSTLGSISNVFSLIICNVYTKREKTGSWNSGTKNAMSDTYSAHLMS